MTEKIPIPKAVVSFISLHMDIFEYLTDEHI